MTTDTTRQQPGRVLSTTSAAVIRVTRLPASLTQASRKLIVEDLAELLLTRQQAAELLHMSPRTLEHWQYKPPPHREVPRPIKVGGSIRYRRRDIEAFVSKLHADGDRPSAEESAAGTLDWERAPSGPVQVGSQSREGKAWPGPAHPVAADTSPVTGPVSAPGPVTGATTGDPDEGELWLRPSQVAEILKVSPITVRKWAKQGALRSVRTVGGHHRYRASDVARLNAELAEPLHPDGGDQ